METLKLMILATIWGVCLAFTLDTLGMTNFYSHWQFWILLICPAIIYSYIGYELNRILNRRRIK